MTDAPVFRTVPLDTPIERGELTIASVQLRKPKSGELRGLTLNALFQADYGALETLIPRISTPNLTKQEVADMDPADFGQMATEVLDFLMTKSMKSALPAQ